MKIRVYVCLGLVGCQREETVEIPDELFEDLNGEEARSDAIEEEAREVVFNMIDWGWEEVDD